MNDHKCGTIQYIPELSKEYGRCEKKACCKFTGIPVLKITPGRRYPEKGSLESV
jgi:hypothetical protein